MTDPCNKTTTEVVCRVCRQPGRYPWVEGVCNVCRPASWAENQKAPSEPEIAVKAADDPATAATAHDWTPEQAIVDAIWTVCSNGNSNPVEVAKRIIGAIYAAGYQILPAGVIGL